MEKIRAIVDGEGVIPFEVVSELGRKLLRDALQTESLTISLSELDKLWHRLQWTACSSSVTDKHLTATCNAVCVFLRCACRNGCAETRAYVFSEQVWFTGFRIVRRAFDNGKNNPGLQVLDSLVQILLETETPELAQEMLKASINEMVEIIMTGTPRLRLKEACIVMSVFIKKTHHLVHFSSYFERTSSDQMFKFKQRCLHNNIQLPAVDPPNRGFPSNFLLALLLTASKSEPRTVAIKLFSLLCSRTDKIDMSQNVDAASGVIEMCISANEAAIKEFVVDVFPAVLGEREQFQKFLAQFDLSLYHSVSRLSIYLAILQVGRQKGFVTEQELPKVLRSGLTVAASSTDAAYSAYDAFQYILSCDAPNIRLQAFNLLTVSSATTSFIPLDALNCFARSMKYLYDDTDAFYRDEYISIARRFLIRLDRGGQVSQRLQKGSADEGTDSVHVQYIAFLRAWISFLLIEISPQASYQRHILALQSLRLIMSTQSQDKKSRIIPPEESRGLILALLDLTFDAYDDVRSLATLILDQMSLDNHELVSSQLKRCKVIELGQKLSATTNRADHADALGRLFMLEALLFHYKTRSLTSDSCKFSTANLPILDLAKAVGVYIERCSFLDTSSTFPLHGSLSGLYHSVRISVEKQLQLADDIAEILLRICHRIWILVQGELCIDSPETATDEDEGIGSEGPKDLLAYAWRALRDASLIMQSMLDSMAPTHSFYDKIGSLCLEQLTKLRHRGAFSTVAQTFLLCCSKCRSMQGAAFQALIQSWTELAFKEIEDQSAKLTRRSAGLPAMFAALLDPTSLTEFLYPVKTLTQLAKTPADTKSFGIRLPQVHALNCLKDIMTNSRFRIMTEPLVVDMLNLAAYSLSSQVWAIRNCGLMLFRACINRLSPDSPVPYGHHAASPSSSDVDTPLAVAIGLLRAPKMAHGSTNHEDDDTTASEQSEVIFAALDLLSRVPCQSNGDDLMVNELVREQLSSKLWAVREQAARLAATRVSEGSQIQVLEDFLHSLDGDQPSNILHGKLLTGRHLLRNCQTLLSSGHDGTELLRVCNALDKSIKEIFKRPLHPVVASGFIDLLNDTFAIALARPQYQGEAAKVFEISRNLQNEYREGSGFFLLRRALALNWTYLCIYKLANDRAQQSETGIQFVPIGKFSSDRDTAIYVVEELLSSLLATNASHLLHILNGIFSESDSSEVRAAAMLGASRILSQTQAQFKDDDIARLKDGLNLLSINERSSWNVRVRLTANILRLSRNSRLAWDHRLLYDFTTALKISQQDEVEMPTRLHAAEAVAEVAPILTTNYGRDLLEEADRIRLLSTLYDFLNDDDDDIRHIAIAVVHQLNSSRHPHDVAIASCALASREALMSLLLSEFPNSHLLTSHACIKVIGVPLSVAMDEASSIIDFCERHSVDAIVRDLLDRASDLFAEERQNLYVDDIAEVQIWMTVIMRNSLASLTQRQIASIVEWACDGLEYLATLLRIDINTTADEVQGPIATTTPYSEPVGVTYNAEVLIIFIRVITMAGLLRRVGGGTTEHPGVTQDHVQRISCHLQELRSVCLQTHAQVQVLLALEQSLSDS